MQKPRRDVEDVVRAASSSSASGCGRSPGGIAPASPSRSTRQARRRTTSPAWAAGTGASSGRRGSGLALAVHLEEEVGHRGVRAEPTVYGASAAAPKPKNSFAQKPRKVPHKGARRHARVHLDKGVAVALEEVGVEGGVHRGAMAPRRTSSASASRWKFLRSYGTRRCARSSRAEGFHVDHLQMLEPRRVPHLLRRADAGAAAPRADGRSCCRSRSSSAPPAGAPARPRRGGVRSAPRRPRAAARGHRKVVRSRSKRSRQRSVHRRRYTCICCLSFFV